MVQIYKTKTGELFYLSCQKKRYMRILFVAATEAEVGGLISGLGVEVSGLEKRNTFTIRHTTHKPDHRVLITGVGMVATAYALGRELAANKYDLAINLGIAGSFDRNIALGDVVEITTDAIAGLGAEDDDTFVPISQMGFGESVFIATESLVNVSNKFNLKEVTAITVNTVHGNEASIQKIQKRLNPQIESMEGAASFYECREAGVPCLQIRAV
jgi:futalosine hydrolase